MELNKKRLSENSIQFFEVLLTTTKEQLAKKPSVISHTEYGNTFGSGVSVDTQTNHYDGLWSDTSRLSKAINGRLLAIQATAVMIKDYYVYIP